MPRIACSCCGSCSPPSPTTGRTEKGDAKPSQHCLHFTVHRLGCRDEVLAEWRLGSGGGASLHVHCHVSGEERWLAPPGLRDFIFRREMPLVRAVCGATGRPFALIGMHWMGAGWTYFKLRLGGSWALVRRHAGAPAGRAACVADGFGLCRCWTRCATRTARCWQTTLCWPVPPYSCTCHRMCR